MSKGQETRQQIIQRSAALFNQHGYSSSSISDVMEATGLQKGGIYRHFKSKEELALAAFDYGRQLVTQRLNETIRSESEPLPQLRALVQGFATAAAHPALPGGCPVFNAIAETDDGGDPTLRSCALAALQQWEAMVGEIVRRGIEQGSIRPTVEPAATAAVLISTLEGALLMSRIHQSLASIQYAVDHLLRFLDQEIAQPRP